MLRTLFWTDLVSNMGPKSSQNRSQEASKTLLERMLLFKLLFSPMFSHFRPLLAAFFGRVLLPVVPFAFLVFFALAGAEKRSCRSGVCFSTDFQRNSLMTASPPHHNRLNLCLDVRLPNVCVLHGLGLPKWHRNQPKIDPKRPPRTSWTTSAFYKPG